MKMAQAFVEEYHEVHLAAPTARGRNNEVPPAWHEIAIHYGLTKEFSITWLSSLPALRRYDYAWLGLRWARGWGADVIFTRLPQAAALGSLIGVPTILEMHDLPRGFMPALLFNGFLKGRGARRLVSISRALERDLKLTFPGLPEGGFIIDLADGVDLSRYAGLPDPIEARRLLKSRLDEFARRTGSSFSTDRFTAGYTGHLYPGRGIDLILAMARELPEVNFLVCGGEPEDIDEFAGIVRERGLDNLTITGFIPNSELPLFQAACEVLLMPYQSKISASSGGDISRYLSPMKLFEYLACGRGICSSDLPVLREVLTDRNAILLPYDDVSSWVEALQKLSIDPELRSRLSDEARATAAEYSWVERAKSILSGL
jgi:glycosyltransferase involved in cell wall biosynthesis